jgi:Protein of unknown function (DUF3987)
MLDGQQNRHELVPTRSRGGNGNLLYAAAHSLSSGKWVSGTPQGPRIPYRLPQLLAASLSEIVFACEGEKDADNVAAIGLVATSAPEGAGKWTSELNPWFTGRHVVLPQDNDEAGRGHAHKVAAGLFRFAASIRILELPGLKAGGDVSDWLEEGGTKGELLKLAREAPEYKGGGEPRPIIGELKPAPAFEAAVLLPEPLRTWIMDEADRMPCAPDYIAVATLVGLGSIISTRCAIKPKKFDPWLVVANIWGAIVGDPSVKKSPSWIAALKALGRLIAREGERYRKALEEYEMKMVAYEARKKRDRSSHQGGCPKARQRRP